MLATALTTLAPVRRSGVVLLVSAVLVTAVSLWTLWPRLGHTFPSLVDDWAAISRTPGQIGEALTLRNPEDDRYRPAWIAWNHLQWHSFGAPEALWLPTVWGLLRTAVLIAGVAAAALVLIAAARLGSLTRVVLVTGSVVAVVTIPQLAVDLARYGPQEPLMVGLMCGGSALLAFTAQSALRGELSTAATAALGAAAAALVWLGVGQKESSICALALVPFLWPALRSRKAAFAALPAGTRRALVATACLVATPFAVVGIRVVQLALADERIYGAEPSEGILGKIVDQLTEMQVKLDSWTGWYLVTGAVLLTAAALVRRRGDWLGVGLLVTSFMFLVFASSTGVEASRYYLPSLVLVSLASVRALAAFPGRFATAFGVYLVFLGLWQAPEARQAVEGWLGWERAGEAMVREVAMRGAGGCDVDVTGPDVELVAALPVLVPLAEEEAAGCTEGETFTVVMTGTSPWAEDPNDPMVVACNAEAEVYGNVDIGRILRCRRGA
jgi:hypothetical protein